MSSFETALAKELEKLKKKKKEETVTPKSSRTSTFNDQLNAELLSLKEKGKNTGNDTGSYSDYSVSTTEDIAPVRHGGGGGSFGSSKDDEKKEDSEKTWFQKSELFDDGYDFGDVTKTILGSNADLLSNVGAGLVGIGEKVVDAALFVAPYITQGMMAQSGAYYNVEYARMADAYIAQGKQSSEQLIKKDLYDEKKVADAIIGVSTPGLVNKALGVDQETDSVFAEKSDELAQSAGQLVGTTALQAAGVPWYLTTGVTSFGGEVESALNQGATMEEAGLSGMITAGAEILTEKISGGISFGGKTLDDFATKELAKIISDKTVRTLAKLGVDMVGEGAEEVLSGVLSAVGQKLTYADEKELSELFTKEDMWDSFIGGAVLGGGSGTINAVKSSANGVDYASELNLNDKKVVDKVYKDLVAEEEKNGKVSQKRKSEIYDDVLEQLDRGYISTETIEEVLGGDNYTAYQDTIKQDNEALAELAELYEGDELKQRTEEFLNNSKRSEMAKTLSDSVYDMVKDTRLGESYRDRARRGQKFEADVSQYDEKQRVTIQRAIDSGVLNNTNRTHDMVDFIAKVSADTGVLFDFTNNEKLKDSIFAVNGKTVDGYITKDGITINVNSPRYINTVVGHEITHALEGSKLYETLEKTIFEYAKEKGTYKDVLKEAYEMYRGEEGYQGYEGLKNIKKEAVANLVGDYLFTDKNFINHLSANHQNIFQKAWNEIKYMVKIARAGSNEAKKLLEVQKAFEEAYRNGGKTTETKYSFSGVNPNESGAQISTAEKMEAEGKSSEEIRQETGWFRSYDNRWRYEIDDSKAVWHLDTAKPDSNRLYRFGEKSYKLKDLLEHEELYKAYPQLKDVTVYTNSNTEFGGYVVGRNTDHIAMRDIADNSSTKWTLIHELQHIIQNIEGFAPGASKYEYSYLEWGEKEYEALAKRNEVAKKLYAILRRHGESISREAIDYNQNAYNVSDEIIEDNYWKLQNLGWNNKRTEALVDEYYAQVQILNRTTPDGQYHATAGEIEAYDAQARMNMSAEERKAMRPNIDRADAIVKYSLSKQTDTSFTPAEIHSIQSVGRKSINAFDSNDIAATEKFAQRYWEEIGTKSPFYRAWFGDWRANDTSPIQVATKQGDTRVNHINKDTGWLIRNSGKVHDETKTHHSIKNREAVPYLPYIDEIIENAVLLNTEGIGSKKSENSLLMHYLYAVADIGNGPEVLKLHVEEMYNPGQKKTDQRAYNLQNIEKAFVVRGRVQGNSPSSGTNTTNAANTVADLFALVKRMDADFVPNESSKIVNADGTPKVMYHGSPEQFTVFDRSKAKSSGLYGKGFYFTDSTSHAGTYGNLYEVYLNIRNPLQSGGATVSRSQVRDYIEAVAENEDYSIENYGTYDVDAILDNVMGKARTADAFKIIQDINATAVGDMVEAAELFNSVNGTKFDGIVVPTETVAFYPEQIKSATDNVGTFDKSNTDIQHSLSVEGTQPAKHGNWHISGKDVALETAEDIAPVAETVSKTESVAPVADEPAEELFPDDLDSIHDELDRLHSNQFEIRGALEAAMAIGDASTMSMLAQEYENATARIRELEAQEDERLDSLNDADVPPEMDTERYEAHDTTPLNKKTVTDLTKKVKSMLGVKNNRTGEVVSMIEAYSRSENPSSEQLFRDLKKQFGTYTEKYVDDATKEVKALLRGYKINVSDSIKSEIADYRDLMRRNFGRVRFSKEGMAVDEVYTDLSAGYPGYFPESIINPTDQLMQIINVANMDGETVLQMEVDDETLADAARTIARTVNAYKRNEMQALSDKQAKESFDSLIKSADEYAPVTEDDIAPVVKQKEQTAKIEKPAEIAPEGKIKTVKERLTAKMQSLETELANNRKLREESWSDYDSEIARAQAEYNAKSNKNTVAANDLLRRIERLNRMKHTTDADYAKRISDLEAKTAKVGEEVRTGQSASEQGAMRQELHNRILSNIRTRFENSGFDFDNVLRNAKNLSTFATVDNTPQRVMEKALGYKAGQVLSDLTVNKVAQNETEGIKWLNIFTDRKNGVLANMSKQYHIKPGSKESAAAQMYAEGFYVNGKNEIVQYGDAELAQDFPNAKVRENIKGLARDPRIRMIYDGTLDKINESRARNAYPEIQRLDNYFLHFRAMDDTFSKLGIPFNPNDIKAKDLPTDLNGVTADLKPGQPYFASAMHRTGKRTSFDLLGGLERYLSSAKNQIYHIDDIQTLRALRNYVADTYGQAKGLESLDLLTEEEAQERIEKVYGSHLSTFAKFLNEEANVIAGKTALIDRGLEGIIGRRGITFLDTVNQQVGKNMVGFNVSSSLTNFLPVAQTFAKTNKFDFVKALAQTTANKVGSIFGKTDGFTENSPVVIRRKGEDRFYRTPWQKVSDTGYLLMGAVDDISTELIARTKFNELTRKGMDSQQAHIETDKWVSRLMGDRSLGQQPQLYNSKMLGMITKFQLEVRNQLDAQFYDTIQETKASNEDIQNGLLRNAKTAAKVASTFVQLAVAQHLFGKAFESVAGYNPAFDIISAIIKAAGWDDDEDDEDTVLDNIEEGFLELLGDLPYTSTLTGGRIPISSALPIQQFVTGKDQYGNEKSRWDTLKEAAPYYVLPGGYGQAKKTWQGLSMFDDDLPVSGSYTNSGNLRFPVEDTLGNRVQAGLFGQYASANARDYFDNERNPLKPNQIQEYIDSDLPIRDYWDYREGLSGLDSVDAKGDYIGGLDLPISTKNLFINNIAQREDPIDMTDYSQYPNFHEFDWAEQNEKKYAFLQEHGMSYADYEKLDEDSKKAYTWAYNNPERYEFVKEQGLSATEYYALDDDTKDAYKWAYDNPEMFTVSKAISDDFLTYYQYKTDLSKLNAKDENGESVSGLKKERVIDYINSLDIDYGQKIILFRSMYDGKADQEAYNAEIVDYLNSRDDISYQEMVTILKKLGFTVGKDGTVTW